MAPFKKPVFHFFLCRPGTITKIFLWFFCFGTYYYRFLLFTFGHIGRSQQDPAGKKYFSSSSIFNTEKVGNIKELLREGQARQMCGFWVMRWMVGLCHAGYKWGWSVFYTVVCRPALRDWWLITGHHHASPAADRIFTLNTPGTGLNDTTRRRKRVAAYRKPVLVLTLILLSTKRFICAKC